MVLPTRALRTLHLSPAADAPTHLSAASGLVQSGDRLYVVADDELGLGEFARRSAAPGRLLPLFDGVLPAKPKARKAAKPDLEALCRLPPGPRHPHGALLALGSGSRLQRQRGALIGLDAAGRAAAGAPRVLDLAELLGPLRSLLGELNIEGAFISGPDFCLLQRGNAEGGINACIRYPWPALRLWLDGAGPVPPWQQLQRLQLGELQGVPLGLTDGAGLSGGGFIFSAAAEGTDNSYDDGRIAGSAIGVVDAAGHLLRLLPLDRCCKVEGLSVSARAGGLSLLLVTDADDRQQPAQLLAATL